LCIFVNLQFEGERGGLRGLRVMTELRARELKMRKPRVRALRATIELLRGG